MKGMHLVNFRFQIYIHLEQETKPRPGLFSFFTRIGFQSNACPGHQPDLVVSYEAVAGRWNVAVAAAATR
jgi:hypothetical protein